MKKNFLGLTALLVLFLFSIGTKAQIGSLQATLSLTSVDNIMLPYQNGFVVPSFDKQDRTVLNLKGTWKKLRFTANADYTLARRDSAGLANILSESNGCTLPGFDDSGWENKTLPAVENEMHTYPTVPEFFESGVWYRSKFTVTAENASKFAKLMFYSVNYVVDVWVNGTYLGYHEGGYTPFAFDISSNIHAGTDNSIVLRVHNIAWGTRKDIVPYSKVDWFNYAGVIHDMYVEYSEKLSVLRADIVPLDIYGKIRTTVTLSNLNLTSKNADVKIEVFKGAVTAANITNEKASAIVGALANLTGTSTSTLTIPADSVKVWRTELTIPNPDLWSPANPNLYVMKVTVSENGVVKDVFHTQFGVRTATTDRYKFLLNQKVSFFTGVARHEDHPVYGRSIPIDTIYTDLLKLKSVNANMLRSGHYPNHPGTYILADRLGIVVVEEIPVWQFDEAFAWSIQNSIRRIHEQMFREMVFKDYNRPSILLWSTCNECLDVTNRATYIQRCKIDLSSNYDDHRMVTQSAAADRPGPADASMDYVDVMGWTMYFGIFHGSTYYDGTKYFLVDANIAHPTKPILDTEFGYWSGEDGSSSGLQVTACTETFRAFKYRANLYEDGTRNELGYLMGTTWWCIYDWYRSTSLNGYQSMGLFDMKRTGAKPVMATLKGLYAPYYAKGGQVPNDIIETGNQDLAVDYNLEQNYPNPFNPETVINYVVPKSGNVTIKLFNTLGQEIKTLVNQEKQAGKYSVTVDATKLKLSSGVYFYNMVSGDFTMTKKMMLVK